MLTFPALSLSLDQNGNSVFVITLQKALVEEVMTALLHAPQQCDISVTPLVGMISRFFTWGCCRVASYGLCISEDTSPPSVGKIHPTRDVLTSCQSVCLWATSHIAVFTDGSLRGWGGKCLSQVVEGIWPAHTSLHIALSLERVWQSEGEHVALTVRLLFLLHRVQHWGCFFNVPGWVNVSEVFSFSVHHVAKIYIIVNCSCLILPRSPTPLRQTSVYRTVEMFACFSTSDVFSAWFVHVCQIGIA